MFAHRIGLSSFRSLMFAGFFAILAGCSGHSSTTTATADSAMAAPSDLVATAGNAEVTLNWTAQTGASGYHVKRSTTSGGAYTEIAAATAAAFADTSVTNGQMYFYVVSAFDATSESADSASVSAAPEAPAKAPAAPAQLTATPGNAQASLTWSTVSGASSYEVERSTLSGGGYSQVTSTMSPSYTDAAVHNGVTYFYVVKAANSVGASAPSPQASVTPDPAVTTPAIPTGFAASAGNAQVSLTWTATSGATSYHVKRSTSSGGTYTQIGAPTAAAYTDTAVSNGSKYYYVVSALDSAGESNDSSQVSATPVAPAMIPAVPTGLSATSGDAQVSLTWTGSSAATSYHVKRSTSSGGPYTQVGAPTSAAYADTTVSDATKYYYVVSALDSTGESANSPQVSATPSAPGVTPAAPAGFAASAGNAQVSLNWTASSGATSYHVKRSTSSGGPYAQVGAPTTPAYTDSALTNGTTYYYVVSALDATGESANSAEVSAAPVAPATIPTAPTGLGATAGKAQVSLNWTASNGATGYHVKRASSSGGPYTQVGAPSTTAYTDSALTNGTTYYYVVSALDSAGESANSAEASAAPVAPTITACNNLPAVGVWQNITPGGIDLSGFGVNNVNLVPSNPSTLYVGTSISGLWKSVDCGANFVQIDTGTLGSDLSKGGMNALIDPTDPNVMYTDSLYGLNGFFKSTDGGVNFVSILPSNISSYAPYGGFVNNYDMDPSNHLHLLVTWHSNCASPYNSSCYAETLDGGVTWTMRNGDASWNGGEGAFLNFLDSNRWLFSSQDNGLWLSTDQGATWNQITAAQVAHAGGQLLRMKNGSFYMAGANGVLYSSDGTSWAVIPNSGNLDMGLATDGTTIWTSQSFPYNVDARPAPAQRYWMGSAATPMAPWTSMTSPDFSSGACWLSYDPVHHILYSGNYWDGVWRVVLQ